MVLHVLSDRVLLAETVEPSPLQRALGRLEAKARKRRLTPAAVRRALAEARQEAYRERKA